MNICFCSMIGNNKIANLGINFRLNYGLNGQSNKKDIIIDRSLLLII